MINRVVLVGRITRDPELRKTTNNISCVNFTLACNRRFSKEGDQEADFINCQAWRGTADFIAQYVNKGALLGVEGRIQTRNYDDKNGNKIYITEVVCDQVQLLAQKRENQTQQQNAYQPNNYQQDVQPPYESDFGDTLDIADDDLPF